LASEWCTGSVDAVPPNRWGDHGWMYVLGTFATCCCRIGSNDGVDVLRFGGLEVGPFLIEATFGGGDILGRCLRTRLVVRLDYVIEKQRRLFCIK
jgi:hypothetical protein